MYIFISTLLLFSLSSSAAPEDREDWLDNFKKTFIENFCEAPEVFNCYSNFSPNCPEDVGAKVIFCSKKIQLPLKIKLGPESGLLGADIGRCVGRELEKTVKKKNAGDPKCKSLL
ncbi:MAG: hypothetical protein JNM24_19530 [Bdellovibrionaceae bacterium]|nr:hypothetical protein [Pseudobdellovibrionaceae bacterium]